MTGCPCDKPEKAGLVNVPAGLNTIPRQLGVLGEVRQEVLSALIEKIKLLRGSPILKGYIKTLRESVGNSTQKDSYAHGFVVSPISDSMEAIVS